MHRTTFLPRALRARVLGASLLLGLALAALAPTARAQGQAPGFGQQFKEFGDPKDAKAGGLDLYIIVLPKDSTRQIEMSTKELIAEFRSENPKVVKVQALLDNPRAVLVTGVGPGSTRVYITDVKKNTESLEVRVPLDEEAEREAKRRDLLDQIRKAVPTANVDVQATGNATIVLSGTVTRADSIQVLMELARGVFGLAYNVVDNMRLVGVQQVQIEVTVARVSRSKARSIGFSFLQTGQQHFLASTASNGGNLIATSTLPSILAPAASLSATPNAVFGIFNDKEGFFGYLQALTTEGLAKLISEPKVITQSGRPAWIVSGGETPILTSSGAGAPTVSYKMFGTIVSCLPIIMGNGKIHLEVRPEISARNDANGISIPSTVGPSTQVPGFDIRTAQVTVELEDGQTLAIGGLIQNTINASNQKVPILGDIPILAFAFTNKLYKEDEEEFIILVTPHLIDPMACTQLPKYLPGRETRTADDFELFLEGILEAPRGQRQLTHPYTAAYTNGATGFPCGDASGNRCGTGSKGCATGSCTSSSGGCNTPAPKTDIRPVGDTGMTPGSAPMVAPAYGTLPSLPPAPGMGAETRLTPATFGPAVLTDR